MPSTESSQNPAGRASKTISPLIFADTLLVVWACRSSRSRRIPSLRLPLVLPERLVAPLVAGAAGGRLLVHQRGAVAALREQRRRVSRKEGGDQLVGRIVVAGVEDRALAREEAVARLQFGDALLGHQVAESFGRNHHKSLERFAGIKLIR